MINIHKKLFTWFSATRVRRLVILTTLSGLLLFVAMEMKRNESRNIAAYLLETDARFTKVQSHMDVQLSRRSLRKQTAIQRNAVLRHIPPAAGQFDSRVLSGFVPAQEMEPAAGGSSLVSDASGSGRISPVDDTGVAWYFTSPYLPPDPSIAPPAPPLATALHGASAENFPAFERSVYPVSRVPNWGAMRSPAQWDRSFKEMSHADMVPLPRYDLKALIIPIKDLVSPVTEQNVPLVTAKLVYSTRYYGAYDLDAGEFTGAHPGLDIKLAFGTPIGALAGGRVSTVIKDANMGLYVMIEHRLADGTTFFSIYGHMDTAWVREGEDVRPGQSIGTVGMTGNTTAPHVHLQVDRDDGVRPHIRYWPRYLLSQEEADLHTIHPITFIEQYAAGA